MASRGQSLTITYVAWDTVNNIGKTGDVANHTLRWIKDGASSPPTNAASEVDGTNAPGIYKITLTGTECTADVGVLAGKSSSSGVSIIPMTITFELLPTALVGGKVDTNVATVAGASQTAGDLAAMITVVDDYVDTEVAAIKAKTDQLGFETINGVTCVKSDQKYTTYLVVADAGNGVNQFLTDMTFTVDDAVNGGWVHFVTGALAGLKPIRISQSFTSNKKLVLVSGFTSTPAPGDSFEFINK